MRKLLYTRKTAAAALGITPVDVDRLVRQGKLRIHDRRSSNGQRIFHHTDIEAVAAALELLRPTERLAAVQHEEIAKASVPAEALPLLNLVATNPGRLLFTSYEVGVMLGTNLYGLRKLILEGRLKCRRIGSRMMFTKQQLEDFYVNEQRR